MELNTTLKFSGCEPRDMFDFPKSICIIHWVIQKGSHNLTYPVIYAFYVYKCVYMAYAE